MQEFLEGFKEEISGLKEVPQSNGLFYQDEQKPNCEVALKGLCQLLYRNLKCLNNSVAEAACLPNLDDEIHLIFHGKEAYSIKNYENIAFNIKSNKIEEKIEKSTEINEKIAS